MFACVKTSQSLTSKCSFTLGPTCSAGPKGRVFTPVLRFESIRPILRLSSSVQGTQLRNRSTVGLFTAMN